MYHTSRALHRWVGVTLALFLALIAITGFLLANKPRFGWLRPPEAKGGAVASTTQIVSVHAAVSAAFALGHPELASIKDVDRVDYRPKDNIFKVTSKDGYREVQVDGADGKVLSDSYRRDQLTEDIHDLSFFAEALHLWLLPLVAVGLLWLAGSGVGMFLTPVVRRWRYYRKRGKVGPG